ncbi:MAG: endolytic transglycosylase MltG [Chromatiales bacterium]|nr:MAG: endolytic transglycosylase MltG [Chromatiales bacterium]
MHRRLILVTSALLLLAGGAAAIAVLQALRSLDHPVGPAAEAYVLDVLEGRGLGELTAQLARDGILARPRVLRWYARWRELDQRIQAGEYLLDATLTPRDILDKLVAGDVRLYSLTVVEGWTVRDLLAAIRDHPSLQQTLGTDDPELLPAALSIEVEHAEGWFFPDTYRFPRGTSDAQLLLQAYQLMSEKLADAWSERALGLPFSNPYDALILASVVERETALDEERSRVAGVFVRRLERGMRLQTDPTVIYGLGASFDGNLRRHDLRTDTPYNTYTRKGLPPTPIALPGEASLRAAVNPVAEDTLYFVATGLPDGSHTFSSTLEEHNAAVAVYLERLRRKPDGS